MGLLKGTLVCVFAVAIASGVEGKQKCYDGAGCFSDGAPFADLPLPWSPAQIEASLALYTRRNRFSPQYPSRRNRGDFSTSRETKLLIHGFNSDAASSNWMKKFKDALLNKDDFNLVLVDWGAGAKTGITEYTQAASNTRVLAQVITNVLRDLRVPPRSVHCLGHSLGAHVCGFVGDTLGQLGRISGLDPAGPNFKGKPAAGRLSPESAAFVDNIHTHGQGGLFVNFGIGEPIGHVDFFPNGGGVQPGCWNRRRRQAEHPEVAEYGEGFSCSHGRSYEFYLESITSSCDFPATQCSSLAALKQKRCNSSCGRGGCQKMGYGSVSAPARGVFYLTTNRRAPYCRA